MMIRTKKISALILAMVLLSALLAGCGQSAQPAPTPLISASVSPTATAKPTPVPTPTPKPTITISGMFPGTEPAGLPAVFEQLNARLDKEISVKLELSWTPEKTYDADMNAALASGKQIDFFWCSSDKLAAYAGKSLIAPLDEYIIQYGQALTKNIDAQLFDTMKISGKLMGVPSAGNAPLADAGHVFTLREDLRQKYSLPKLDSIANLEQYFKAIHDNEPDITPLCSDQTATLIMPAFGPEDLLGGTGGAVAYKINADSTVTCVPLQSAVAFTGAVAKVREWYINGWIPEDMVDIKDSQAQLSTGKAAATDGSALSAVSEQAVVASAVPGAELADQPVPGAKKYITGNGGSALCLVLSSKSPAEVVQFWNWVLTSQDNYDLFCYGIAGKNFQLDGDKLTYLDDSYQSFPSWIFANMNFERFPAGASDDYINTIKHWNDGATVSPLMGFVFNPAAVSAVLANVQKVYDTYSPALNAGSSDTPSLLAEFGARMKAAGQDQIVAEAQKQINAFLAAVK